MEERWVLHIEPCKSPNLVFRMVLVWVLLLGFLSIPFHFPVPAAAATADEGGIVDTIYPEDRSSLLMFKSQLQDPPLLQKRKLLYSWESGVNYCSNWSGVECSNQNGRVISLNLTSFNLSGQIHPILCQLQLLHTLILSHNYFYGQIPSCFAASSSSLTTLDLSHNLLTGPVPPFPWFDSGSDGNDEEHLLLRDLDLSHNDLTGNLRDFVGKSALVNLNLESNLISGTLPCFSASVEMLSVLNLGNNSIVGGIPTCISSLKALTQLNLSFNGLEYEMSPRFVFSEKLFLLDLSFNKLTGHLPSKIASSDEVDEDSSSSGLLLLDLSHNQFYGEIPIRITQLKSLQALFLSHNLLTGEIPSRIGNLTYLQVIDLSHNLLSGSIPLNIVGCFQLLALLLNNNNLTGQIQPELDALDSLKILDISNNMISGEIPLTLAGCKSLEVVDFSHNNMSGPLNDAITKWSKLKFLSVAWNNFNGNLPSWLFSFEAIRALDLSRNKFSGYIPSDANFNVSFNFNFNNSSNSIRDDVRFSGIKLSVVFGPANSHNNNNELSISYGGLSSMMIGVDFSDNMLHGEIPDGLLGLQGFEYLNLSYNFLGGQIPTSLERMSSLRILDLSHNSLSGQIPENISSLGNLTLLNLSYNCFSGIVPKKQGEGYWKFPGAFAGNPDLCVESWALGSGGGCNNSHKTKSLPAAPTGKTFKEEMEEGPISIWVFCISAFVSFYFGVVGLFCSARTRHYILQTKA